MVVTNRELLRNYREIKEKLLNGDVKEVVIPQKGSVKLKISVEKQKTPYQQLRELIRKHPIHITRPEEDII